MKQAVRDQDPGAQSKYAAKNSLQDRICLQIALGGEATHSQPSAYNHM